jgi:hypothetical protein
MLEIGYINGRSFVRGESRTSSRHSGGIYELASTYHDASNGPRSRYSHTDSLLDFNESHRHCGRSPEPSAHSRNWNF